MRWGAIFAAICLASAAHAEHTTAEQALSEYDNNTNGWAPMWELALSRVHDGLVVSNAYLTTDRHEKPLFCEPGDLVITGDELREILRAGIRRIPPIAKAPWELALLYSLRDRYPCP